MSDFAVQTLLQTPSVTVRDICCAGGCRHQSAEECASATELVFPYRGVYARHLGRDQAVAEANQVLFFNAAEAYRVSHPVAGGDASLTLNIDEKLLRELAPKALLRDGGSLAFRHQRSRIDPRSQALVALLRHGLRQGTAQPLEAESLALTLVQRALGPRTSIKAKLHHPQLLAVKVWAFGHLLATGMLHDVLLFGAFLLWAIVLFAVSRRRDRVDGTTYPAGTLKGDVVTVLIGVVVWALFAFWLHLWLIGVNPMS